MPALVRQGPFSYDSNGYSSTRTYNLVKAAFVADKGDILEVVINGVKIVGEGANVTNDEFTVNSLTNPTSITVATTFTTTDPATSSALVFTSGTIIVKRLSNRSTAVVDFAPGSVIREQDLDDSTNQTLHVAQEAMDIAISGMVLQANDKFDGRGKVIEDVAVPVADNDVVTKTYLEDTWLTSTDKTNSATVAGISSDVTAVATAPVPANLNTLVNHYDGTTATSGTTKNLALLNTVALRNSEIGLLGTSAMGHATTGHLALLANADVRGDMALLGADGVIEDMALLGATGVIEDMAQLTATGVVADMALLAGNSASGNTVIEDMNTLATSDIVGDLNTLAESDIVDDLAAIGATGVIGDIETCADNLVGINAFAARYRVASTDPTDSKDEGDLYYDTTNNLVKFYNGSAWGAIGLNQQQTQTEANNSAVAMSIALG